MRLLTLLSATSSVFHVSLTLASSAPSPTKFLKSHTGLLIETLREAKCERKTKNGDLVSVNYKGRLQSDGTEFDSSFERGEPFEFVLGKGEVIQGWEQGLLDMCVGEWRQLTIPPELAYGDRGSPGAIPPKAILIFETHLEKIAGLDDEPEANVQAALPNKAPQAPNTDELHPPPPPPPPPRPQGGPKDDEEENDGECHLLGPFSLVVQGALGGLALLSLVWKRYHEVPRRPLKIWWFDVSKQVFGSVLLHLANLFMSMLSSGDFDVAAKTKQAAGAGQDDERQRPNPCSFYLLNLAIDVSMLADI